MTPRSIYGRILLHVLFWAFVILFYTFVYGRMAGNYFAVFVHLVVTLPVYLATTYFTLYYIIPKFLFNKNYKAVIVSAIYMVLGAAFIEILIFLYFIVTPADFFVFGEIKLLNPSILDIYLRLIGIFIVVFFAASIKLLKHWYNSQRMNQLLTQQKLEAELNFLKSQVHPHFLFNTLNNLYALTLKKSDKSPEVVLKLSEMLDYMLYECNTDKIALKKEMKLIKNYISLEQLRYGERLEVNLNISGSISGKAIAPMILFPFVENSFKHGVSRNTGEAWIDIKLETDKNNLKFNISNGKPKIKPEKNSETGEGIGLNNVKQRLHLLYPENSRLDIVDEEKKFSVMLQLDLNESINEQQNED
ncbi:sensor histidine kinase [Bacteroidota bacterium]